MAFASNSIQHVPLYSGVPPPTTSTTLQPPPPGFTPPPLPSALRPQPPAPPPPGFSTLNQPHLLRPPSSNSGHPSINQPPPVIPPSQLQPPPPFFLSHASSTHLDPVIPINVPTPIKLTYTNFLTWQAQILPIVHGYNFTRFLNSPPPNPTKSTPDGRIEFNQDHLLWSRQDQLLLGWLRSSVSESIQAQLVSCTTSASLWNSIHQQFASTSRAKLIDLKRQWQSVSRGSSSCAEFLQLLRRIADELAFIGAPLTDDDMVLTAINGLGSEFNPFVAAITATSRSESLTFADFTGMLLSHEALLHAQQSISTTSNSSLPAAFATTSGNGFSRTNNRFRNNSNRQGQGRGASGFRPTYSPIQNNGSVSVFKPHNATQSTSSNSQSPAIQSQSSASGGPDSQQQPCQICKKFRHTAKNCRWRYQPDPNYQPKQAYVAQPTNVPNSNEWILDSGASHHVTNDINNLSAFFDYQGQDNLQIGDGTGLPIHHIGTTSFSFSNNITITLKNTLHVPTFSRNLISLSKLLLDNPSLIITFSNSSCFLKDHHTKIILLEATCINGLYYIQALPPKISPQAYLGIRTTAQMWHDRLSQVENLFETTIKTLRTDGGTEYKPIGTTFPQIVHQTTCPHTPQQNGVSERKHRHIIELALATMSNANLPTTFWDEIFSSIVYVINRLPSHNSTIPYTTLFNKQPNYSFLRVLGCACFPYTRPYNSHKLDLRALTCVFVGYSTTQKGYRCLHIPTNKIYVSRHVQFDELSFPFHSNFNTPASSNQSGSPSNQTIPLSVFRSVLAQNLVDTTQALNPSNYAGPFSTITTRSNTTSVPTISTQQQAHHQQFSLHSPTRQEIPLPDRSPICPLSSDRNPSSTSSSAETSETPILTPDNPITTSVTEISPATKHQNPPKHPMITRTRDNTRKPRHFPDFVAHFTALDHEPRTFTQANTRHEWRQAMSVEIDALAANNTWTLVPPPSDQAIIGCKWVYRIKRRSDGTIDRYKARLVAKGFLQQEGVDFFDTFSPVVRPTTIRVILSLAVSHKWSIRQLDVNNAFLHGDLKERVFMSQPPGFIDPTRPNHVCLLSKSLYGLKQSPRAWFQKLSSTLLALGFFESQYDPSLFISHAHNHLTMVLVYVDDILITGSNPSLISSYISHLHNSFSLKDLGDINFFLGIQVTKTPTGLHLNQSKYIHDILVKANMVNAKHSPTPMSTSTLLSTDDSALFDNPKLFRSIIGALQYATLTRPDISFAVNKVSQFMQNPTINHWTAVKRILRFLCGTIQHGLQLQPGSPLDINAYCDADWAGCPVDRRSTTGFCIYLGKNLVSWSAKKQPTVSRSSTEAEYRALAVTCAELLWLRYLLKELRVMPSTPPTIWCDNIGATFLASNPIFHARTKHIEIDFHFCRERIINKEIQVHFLSSSDQIADALTKPLAISRFQFLCNKLTVVPPSTA
ncbi:hypothetical protein LUZ62_030378 [Rhynchospora pubera]|uniref:Integrase catalytic domain-containing protein n=1 Tax=Rhynchospora pubera TaxID=906938 RepID=A0AAV8HP26_9POAL|nr:hypothetical protein LUZ62_030378 [Rhynchospora pubera]